MKRIVREGKRGDARDGDGLILRVEAPGRAYFQLQYRRSGKLRRMSLGSVSHLSLAEARAAASEAHRQIRVERKDPLAVREEQRRLRAPESRLEAVSRDFIRDRMTGKSPRHIEAATRFLLGELPNGEKSAVNPLGALRDRPIAEITVDDVLAILRPQWSVSASRGRGLLERVFDFAIARGDLPPTHANVARWKGRLEHLLPDLAKAKHQAALAYSAAPAFVAALRGKGGLAAKGLQFVALTAVRSNDVLTARWADIDLAGKLWRIPRTKTGAAHEVPLSGPAIDLLAAVRGDFPAADRIFPLGPASLRRVRDELVEDGVIAKGALNPHGLRSTFRDWCGANGVAEEVAEACLAHRRQGVKGAYHRDQMTERRRSVMQAWATFLAGQGDAKVIAMAA